jgi:hypothetical protein
MGKVCQSGVNQAINNPALFGEKIMRIGSVHREIDGGIFNIEKTKTDTLMTIALDQDKMAKVKGMIEKVIEKDMMVKVYDMNDKV